MHSGPHRPRSDRRSHNPRPCRLSERRRIMATKSSAVAAPMPCSRAGGGSDVRQDLRRPGRVEAARLRRRSQLPARCTSARSRTRTASGQSRPSASTGTRTPTKIKNTSYTGNVSIKWYEDGVTNVAYNCIDRHLAKRADQVAIIWEGDDPKDDKKITYQELHDEVCRMANILRNRNVEKGDRVTIYMPMIPEAAYAMLACARIGAIHSVVFGGFSPDFARRPHRGLQVERRHHRRRRRPRRPQDSAQGQHRRRDRQGRRRRSRHRRAPHRRRGRHGSGARRLLRRGRQAS